MKMKATRKTHWLLAGAVCLLVAGFAGASCTKGGSLNLNFRKGVRFSASMSTSGTRTAYSGEGTTDTGGLLTRERIDWTDGDLLRVFSPQAAQPDGSTHYADYEIQSHETVGTPGAQLTSRATVAVKEGTEQLYWEESPGRDMVHDFFAVYPSPTTQGFTPGHTLEQDGVLFAPETVGEDEVMTFTGVIPAEQTVSKKAGNDNIWLPDMRPAYMLATASSTQAAADANGVTLQFIPKFSAFEFTVSAGDNPSVTLTSFSLTATEGYLTGAFTISQENFGIVTEGIADAKVSGGGKEITVDFGPSGITVTNTQPLTFAVIALAQETSGLTVSFSGREIGDRSLELKKSDGTALSWGPYKKHRIYGIRFPRLMDVIIVDPIIWDGEYTSDAIVGDAISWAVEYTGDAHLPTDPVDWSETYGGDVDTNDRINWMQYGKHEGDGHIGDVISWSTDPGIVGPFGGLYLTRGYLLKAAEGYALSGNNQMDIIQYYGSEDVNSMPRHYLQLADLPASSALPASYKVPAAADWKVILGTDASPRSGATVDGNPGCHYAKVAVNVTGTAYESYGVDKVLPPAVEGAEPETIKAINGLVLFPDGATIDCWRITAFDTADDGFTAVLLYDELTALIARGCAFLPCSGAYAGGWQLGGSTGLFWGTGTQLGVDATDVNPATAYSVSSAFCPVRLVKTWE